MSAAVSTSTTEAVWYMIRATGVVSLVLLTLTTVLGLLSAARARSRRWPAFAQVDLHKRATLLALVFLGLHVAGAVLDTYVHVGLVSVVVPFTSSFQPLWTGLGAVAVDLLAAVAISSALRRHIAAGLWRRLHWLAYGCWPFAMAHAIGAGTDAGRLWMDAVAGACTVAVVCALTWRIGYHRTTTAAAGRLGAATRAVPVRHRPPEAGPARPPADAGRRPSPRSTDHTGHTGAPAPRTALRLLERDPR
jgi:methionine sulfoxide reductase heme-binding subunit